MLVQLIGWKTVKNGNSKILNTKTINKNVAAAAFFTLVDT